MSKNLNRHIKSDKAKWAITGIVLVLVIVMLVGMCLQLFGQGKVKPSEWFKKQPVESGEVVEVEQVSDYIAFAPVALSDNSAVGYVASASLTEQEIYSLTGLSCNFVSEDLRASTCSKLHISNNIDDSIVSNFDSFIFFEGSDVYRPLMCIYVLFPRNVFNFPDYVFDSISATFDGTNTSVYVYDDYFMVRTTYKQNGVYKDYESCRVELSYVANDKIVPLPPDPVKEGYTFTGWYLDEACTQKYTGTTVTSDINLYAGWKINRYTVTYNSDGGSVVDSLTVDWNTVLDLPTPTKMGYNFIGWYFSDGTRYENQPITANIELIAKWEIRTFLVTFFVDGEIYNEMTVNYGTYLRKVADQAGVLSKNVISYRFVNADLPVGELGDMVVVDDMEVVANSPSESDKAIGTIKNNWLPIVLGGAGLIALIAIISTVATRKKRR